MMMMIVIYLFFIINVNIVLFIYKQKSPSENINIQKNKNREIITSSAESKDSPEGGGLTVSCERQLKQMVSKLVFFLALVIILKTSF